MVRIHGGTDDRGCLPSPALEAAGVDLRWWGWMPPLVLTAALIGFAVNGWRDLMNDDAIPSMAADVLIGMLVVASTLTIFALQQTALG